MRRRELLQELAEKQRQVAHHEEMKAVSISALPTITGLKPLSGNLHESRLFGDSQRVSGVDISCLNRAPFAPRGNIAGIHGIDKNRVYIMLSWATGYGDSSALAGMALYSTFKTWACPRVGFVTAPADLLLRMNDGLQSLSYHGFAPTIAGIIDIQERKFQFSGAGVDSITVYRAKQKLATTIGCGNSPAVGVFSSEMIIAKSPFQNVQTTLEPDDILLLFSSNLFASFRPGRSADGTEATDLSNGERFGRLVETIVAGGSIEFWLPSERHPEPNLHFPGGSSPTDMIGYIAAVQRLHHVQSGSNESRVNDQPLSLEDYEIRYIQKCSRLLESTASGGLFAAGDILDVVLMAATIKEAT